MTTFKLAMEKISENITVFVGNHFGKQRPYEILSGKTVNSPQFPNIVGGGSSGTKSPSIPGMLMDFHYAPENRRGLFMEGTDFRAGIYHGDVYRVPLKDKYYLFRVVREPSKSLILPSAHNVGVQMSIYVESPGGRISRVNVQRLGTIQGDINAMNDRIKHLKGCFTHVIDLASEQVEVYVRAYYLMEKIKKVGGRR